MRGARLSLLFPCVPGNTRLWSPAPCGCPESRSRRPGEGPLGWGPGRASLGSAPKSCASLTCQNPPPHGEFRGLGLRTIRNLPVPPPPPTEAGCAGVGGSVPPDPHPGCKAVVCSGYKGLGVRFSLEPLGRVTSGETICLSEPALSSVATRARRRSQQAWRHAGTPSAPCTRRLSTCTAGFRGRPGPPGRLCGPVRRSRNREGPRGQ